MKVFGVQTDRLTLAMAAFLGLACLSVSVVSFSGSINKIFTLDETDIAARAHMIVKEGPLGPMRFFGGGEAYPHPPLCEYAVALVFKCFGESERAARGLGAVCFVLVGLLTLLSARLLLKSAPPGLRLELLFAAGCLYLVNPLTIQHAMVVDADGFFTFLFVNLFVFVFLTFEDSKGRRYLLSRVLLAVILALAFLSKEGTPLLLAVALLAYRALNRQWRRLAAEAVLVCALGMALAWGVWLVFCQWTGVPKMIFLKQQYGFRVVRASQLSFLIRSVKNSWMILRWPLYWTSAPYLLFLAYGLLKRAEHFIKNRRLEGVDFCFAAALSIWVPYFFVKPSIDIMKYQHPVYPVFLIGAVAALAPLLGGFSIGGIGAARRTRLFLIGLGAGLLLTNYYYKLGDYLFYLADTETSWRWRAFVKQYHEPVLWFLAAAVIYAAFKRAHLGRFFCLACVFLTLPINIALDLRQTALYTTAESWLNYGEIGLAQALDYLTVRLEPGQTTSLRKDFLYYLRLRRGLNFDNLVDPSYFFWPERLKQILLERRRDRLPQFLVLDPVALFSNRAPAYVTDLIMREYRLEIVLGNFKIYKLRSLA